MRGPYGVHTRNDENDETTVQFTTTAPRMATTGSLGARAFLKDVEALRCPAGGELLFTLEQAERIRQRIAASAPRLKLTQKNNQSWGEAINLLA
jgi:hypothetical protein